MYYSRYGLTNEYSYTAENGRLVIDAPYFYRPDSYYYSINGNKLTVTFDTPRIWDGISYNEGDTMVWHRVDNN